MKEAFLIGILSMAANADDNDINIQQINKPINTVVDGESRVLTKRDYVYAITPNDTKTELKPHVTRHITF